jgi:hypothetical protein
MQRAFAAKHDGSSDPPHSLLDISKVGIDLCAGSGLLAVKCLSSPAAWW